MQTRKKAITAKPETVYGQHSAPGNVDAILTSNFNIEPYIGDTINRDIDRPFLGNSEDITPTPYVRVTFDVELAGSGTLGDAPAWGVLFRGCGWAEIINAGTDVKYKLISDGYESISIDAEIDGELQKVPGCRGSVSISFEKGQLPKASFSFIGLYQKPAAGTLGLTPADWVKWKQPIPVSEANTPTFTLHGYDAITHSFSVDQANEVKHLSVVNQEAVTITDRSPSSKVTIEAPRITDKDFYSIGENHAGTTLGAIQLVHGVTDGGTIQVDMPSTQLSFPKRTDLDGVIGYEFDVNPIPSTPDGEIEITVR